MTINDEKEYIAEYWKVKKEIYGDKDINTWREKFPNHFTWCRHRDNSYWYGDMQNIVPSKCQWYKNKICTCMDDNHPCDGVIYVSLLKKREIIKLIEKENKSESRKGLINIGSKD